MRIHNERATPTAADPAPARHTRETAPDTTGRLPLLGPWLALLLTGLLLAGCASVPTDYPRTESTAFQDHEATEIGRYFTKAASALACRSARSSPARTAKQTWAASPGDRL